MQKESFQVLNVKCGGCVSAIQKGLGEFGNVQQVEVDIKSGRVEVEGEALDRGQLGAKLGELGYPEA